MDNLISLAWIPFSRANTEGGRRPVVTGMGVYMHLAPEHALVMFAAVRRRGQARSRCG